MAAILGSTARRVTLQFSFANPDVIPKGIKRREHETPEERTTRKSREGGAQGIEPVENVCLVELLSNLGHAGYEMVDAFYKPRIHGKTGGTYHAVRFLFVRGEYAEPSAEFKRKRRVLERELRTICEQALWRVRGFLNPCYKDGEEIPDQYAVSINLEVRRPLFDNAGNPVRVWRKDEKGNRVGDSPLPLRPDCCLGIRGDTVEFAKS